MSGEVVVPYVLHFMRHGMGGSDVDAAVGEDYPYSPRIPGVSAEYLFHPCGIVRRYGLIVRMRAQGEDMNLPADARGKIIHRRVRIIPRHRLHLVVPVCVLHLGRAGRYGGLLVRSCCRLVACGCVVGSGYAAQAAQGLGARDAVRGQVAGLLVSLDCGGSLLSEHAVRGSLQVAQFNQLLLQGLNVRSGGTDLQRSAGVCCRRRCGSRLRGSGGPHIGRFRVAAVQGTLRLFAGSTVSGQAVCLLEGFHGAHSLVAVVAVRFSGQVSQLDQGFLKLSHVGSGIILAQSRPAGGSIGCRGHFRRGRRNGSRHRSRCCALLQRVVGEQDRIGCLAGHAVILQAVGLLEFLQGIHGSLAHLAVYFALVIAQILQPRLQQLHVVSLVSVLQGYRGNRHGRRGAGGNRHGRSRGVLRAQGGTGHNQFPGGGVGCTVGGQAVLFLEGAYRSDGISIIGSGRSPLQVAQFNQLLLQFGNSSALVALLHGYFLHGAQGSDAGLCAGGILRLAGIQEGLDIRVHNACGRIVILLLESNNGFFRARSEFSVRAAGQEAQLNQCFLQGSYFRAFRTLLQDGISAGVFCRAQCHNRCGSRCRLNLFDFLQHNVIRLHIAGILLVLHLGPGAFHSVYRDLRVRGDLL